MLFLGKQWMPLVYCRVLLKLDLELKGVHGECLSLGFVVLCRVCCPVLHD